MAGKKLSRANMAHLNAAAEHLHAMGAKHPGMADYTPIGKAADASLGDQIQAVSRAVYSMSSTPMDGYCCVEDVFDTYVIIEVCESASETYWRADYSQDTSGAVTLAARDSWTQVEETWTPVANTGKAGLLHTDPSTATPYASMKAIGDRLLEVKVAYYGHKNGRDSHNEYFSPNTDFGDEDFPNPPLLYYHGYDSNGKKMGKPAVTGKFVSRRRGPDAAYLTYKLKNTKHADLQWNSAQKGECVVSPGTIGHLIRKDAKTGELLYWALAEISAWDYAAGREPANLHSVAAPVLKALYISEGLPTSDLLTAASEAPEALGDSASGQAHSGGDASLSPDEVARFVVTQVASAVLSHNMRNT